MKKQEQVHAGHRKRLRERFRTAGLESLADVNCLELILFYGVPRKDTNVMAHDLLERFGSFNNVLDAPVEALMEIPGVTENAATLLKLIPQAARRYLIGQTQTTQILNGVRETAEFLMPRFFGATTEQVYLLCMDAKRKALDCRMVSEGGLNSADVSCRKLVRLALDANASMVVLAHNHVSGLAIPSGADLETTRIVWQAMDNVGVELVDHFIVADDECVSMRDSGYFQDFY